VSKKPEKILRPVFPNVGIEMMYRRMLEKQIDEMHASILYWVKAKYKNNEPEIAQDATPASILRIAINKLTSRWQQNFNRGARELAEYFAQSVSQRSDKALMAILKRAGFTVRFKMTPAQRDVFKATVNANVSLIKSIPQQYLSGVEGIVQRSVQVGGDLEQLTKDLQKQYGVTKRRAAFIALDQNTKATAALQRARHIELGISEALWLHSHGGKTPRPTHVAMDRKKYSIEKGMWDPAEKQWILPGQLINCRCVSRPVVAGFS
jgi:SPP1 gp7 family putative phage head morphogenesis protein